MRKLNSLRAHLAAALPELARNPDALQIFAEGGTLAVRDGANLGFEMRYNATLTFLDCQYAPAQIFLPLTEALDVLPNGEGGYDMDWRTEPPVYGLEDLADPAALLHQLWGQCRDMPADFWTGHDAPADMNADRGTP